MNSTKDEAVPEQLVLSEGLCVALLPQKQRMWTVSHHCFLFSPASAVEQLVLAAQPPLLGHPEGHLCPGLQGRREQVPPAHSVRLPSPLLGLGKSRAPQESHTARGDTGLEGQVTALVNSEELAWSEERKGLRYPSKGWVFPKTEISLESVKNGIIQQFGISGHCSALLALNFSVFD